MMFVGHGWNFLDQNWRAVRLYLSCLQMVRLKKMSQSEHIESVLEACSS